MLPCMGSQRVRHEEATERQHTYQERLQEDAQLVVQHQQHDVGQKAGCVEQAAAEGGHAGAAEQCTQEVAQRDHRHAEVQEEEEDDPGAAIAENTADLEDEGQGRTAHGQHGHILQDPGQEVDSRVHAHHPHVLSTREESRSARGWRVSRAGSREDHSCMGQGAAVVDTWPQRQRTRHCPESAPSVSETLTEQVAGCEEVRTGTR